LQPPAAVATARQQARARACSRRRAVVRFRACAERAFVAGIPSALPADSPLALPTRSCAALSTADVRPSCEQQLQSRIPRTLVTVHSRKRSYKSGRARWRGKGAETENAAACEWGSWERRAAGCVRAPKRGVLGFVATMQCTGISPFCARRATRAARRGRRLGRRPRRRARRGWATTCWSAARRRAARCACRARLFRAASARGAGR